MYLFIFFVSESLSDSELSKRLSAVNESGEFGRSGSGPGSGAGSGPGSAAGSGITSPTKSSGPSQDNDSENPTPSQTSGTPKSLMSPVLSEGSLSVRVML